MVASQNNTTYWHILGLCAADKCETNLLSTRRGTGFGCYAHRPRHGWKRSGAWRCFERASEADAGTIMDPSCETGPTDSTAAAELQHAICRQHLICLPFPLPVRLPNKAHAVPRTTIRFGHMAAGAATHDHRHFTRDRQVARDPNCLLVGASFVQAPLGLLMALAQQARHHHLHAVSLVDGQLRYYRLRLRAHGPQRVTTPLQK